MPWLFPAIFNDGNGGLSQRSRTDSVSTIYRGTNSMRERLWHDMNTCDWVYNISLHVEILYSAHGWGWGCSCMCVSLCMYTWETVTSDLSWVTSALKGEVVECVSARHMEPHLHNDNQKVARNETETHSVSPVMCCGRGSCYGVKPNGDAVEQSHSKGGKLQWGVLTLRVERSHCNLPPLLQYAIAQQHPRSLHLWCVEAVV